METFNVLLSVDKAAEARDGLAKEIYFRLFEWLVARINESTNHPDAARHKIGLLDIFGYVLLVLMYALMCTVNLSLVCIAGRSV
jgi:myosin heavy subunit